MQKARIYILFLFLLYSCQNSNKTNIQFPEEIYIQQESPNGFTTAFIYHWQDTRKTDLLGSEQRYYLGFQNAHSKWYIDYELSEGAGTYESAIISVHWINYRRLYIKRVLHDEQNDLIYDIYENIWVE